MSAHVTVEELADADAGLVDVARLAVVDDHVEHCAECALLRAELQAVSDTLAAEPAPSMPPEVAARLAQVVSAEQLRRRNGEAIAAAEHRHELAHRAKPILAATRPEHRPPVTFIGRALVACVASVAIGFAGYAASARAGFGEPQAIRSTLVSSELGTQAQSLRESADLSAHWLSRAWSCVRKVVDGRVTDLARVTVDNDDALLAYTEVDGVAKVTVVTGCPNNPRAGTTSTLPR